MARVGNEMKKILMIAYDFPPAVSGVRRTVKFVQYLPEFGWEPVVLTVKAVRAVGYDAKPLEEMRERGVRIYRSGSLDPYRLHSVFFGSRERGGRQSGATRPERTSGSSRAFGKRLARAVRRWCFVPDDRMLWIPFGFRRAVDILRTERIRYVYTTSYPNSTHVIGLLLRKFCGVKWAADFRDGWVQNPTFFDPPTPLHRWASARLEREVARRADLVVSVSEPITGHLRRVSRGAAHLPAQAGKFLTITNGYDEEDFQGLVRTPQGKFTLVYTGTFFGERTPEALLRGIALADGECPELREKMQCLLFSAVEERFMRMIRELEIAAVVHVRGFLSYREALQEQCNADVLLIVLEDVRNAEIMVTQKVFEYLAARRPILAIVPEGECRRIVLSARAGTVVSPRDVEGIKRAILDYYGRYTVGALGEAKPEQVEQYSRRELTRVLARSMDAFLCEESKKAK
jgi:glycosyltransferase involved in cell wall biosynthesis